MTEGGDRWQRHERWLYLFFKIVLVSAAALVPLLLAVQARAVVVPLLFAFFVAYQTSPLVGWLHRKGIPRAVTSSVLIFLVIAGVVVFLLLFLPRFIGEFVALLKSVPAYLEKLETTVLPWIREQLGVDVSFDVEALRSHLEAHGSELLQSTGNIVGTFAGGVIGLLSAALYLVLVPVFIFYLSVDYERIVVFCRDLVPHRHRERVFRLAGEMDDALSAFVRGQVTVAIVLAVLYSVGLALLGIKFAIFIGVLAGIANLIPYVGVAIGAGLAILMALLEWTGFGTVIGVAGLFVGGNLLENFVLTPRIVGDRVGLSPLLVIVAILFWGEILGLVGVLIAIPLTAVLRIVGVEALRVYRESGYFGAGQEPAPSPPPDAPAEE